MEVDWSIIYRLESMTKLAVTIAPNAHSLTCVNTDGERSVSIRSSRDSGLFCFGGRNGGYNLNKPITDESVGVMAQRSHMNPYCPIEITSPVAMRDSST